MKTTSLIFTAFLAAAMPALAATFTARTLPAGFNAATQSTTSGTIQAYRSQQPVAADFLGNAKKQWYAGGTVISRFPESGTITLPAITLPQAASATVKPIAGIPMDVDGDGDQDILRVNAWDGMSSHYTMMAFINQGGGSFAPGWRLDFTHDPAFNHGNIQYRLLAGDFDRDGDLDVATLLTYQNANQAVDPPRAQGSLAVRWNDGTGKFATATTLQSTGYGSDANLGAGDFDNDGDLDLICAGHLTATVITSDYFLWTSRTFLFENNGSGGFTSFDNNSFWQTATPLDVNRDGWLDLVNGESVAWNQKTGSVTGGFDRNPWTNGVDPALPVVFADADGDGHVDMIYGQGTSLVMRRGQSTGAWGQAVTLTALPSGVLEIGAADSDADGDVDFFVTLRNGAFVFVENQAHHWAPGAFPAPSGSGVQRPLEGVKELHAADFNQDGIDDLLAVTPAQNRLWVLYGNASGVPDMPIFKNTQNTAPGGATVADIDRDGLPDVAYTLPASGTVRWARNNGTSPFAWTDSAIATGLPGVSLITAGQHGSPNGRDELLTASGATGQLRWLYRTGETWNGQNVLTSASPVPLAILAHNMASGAGDEPFYLSNTSTASGGTLRLRGYQLNGPWTSLGEYSQTTTVGSLPPVLAVGDLNADGKDDLVFVRGDGTVAYTSPGGIISLSIGAAPAAIRAIRIVDWNRDGRQDVLCATANGLSLYYFKNGWKREDVHADGAGFKTLQVMNLNRDGWPDVAASTGTHIHFIKNAPRVLHAVVQENAEVSLNPGEQGLAMQITAAHHGRSYQVGTTWLSDVGAAVTGANVRLHKAVLSDGQWVKGSALTSSELSSIATGLSLLADGAIVGSSGPQLLEASGILPIAYNSVLGNLVPIPGGETRPLHLRVNLRADAAQSSITRFFLTLDTLKARLLNEPDSDRFVSLASASTNSVLVSIVSALTPLQQWRQTHFGAPDAAGARANDADYDHDGVPNLVEYALGTNPAVNEPALNDANALTLLPLTTAQAPAKCRVLFSNSALADAKVRLSIQSSTGLGSWVTVAWRTGGGSWMGVPPDFSIPNGGYTSLVFTTPYKPESDKNIFFRLMVEELP